MTAQTIFALATPPGRAAVAVMRLSGSGTAAALIALAGSLPPPREARVRSLRGPGGALLDQAMTLWLPGPGSYTGEDGAELHLHGGQAVADAVTLALIDLGLQPAEPGEFTRRAFEHGRLDLTQAEAIADLVDAETEGQRRQALDQLGGALSRRYARWRESLLQAMAVLDAAVDFPDEDLPADVAARAFPHLTGLAAALEAALTEAVAHQLPAPNAGKSSLLNRLLGRDAAIVTPEPGTTRDVIEAPMTLAGFKALIADTAGLRAPEGAIEAEGVRRARAWAQDAAVRLWVVDAAAQDGAWREAAGLLEPGDLLVLNKADLAAGADRAGATSVAQSVGADALETAASSGAGLAALHKWLEVRTAAALSGAEFPAATRARHRLRLEEALLHVRRALDVLETGAELAAEDLRLAGRALGRISGRIDPEEVLGRIFASFCIGK